MYPILRTAFANLAQARSVFLQKPTHMHTLTRTPQAVNTVSSLLQPVNINIFQTCGFKVVVKLRRRCKDCFMIKRFNRLHVLCKTHPRHKQMIVAPQEKNTWILTHATQGKIRPW